MPQDFLDRVNFTTGQTGAMSVGATLGIGAAASPETTVSTAAGQTPAGAGATDAAVYTLLIRDGAAWMTCRASYSSSSNNFTITQVLSSSLGFGNPITLDGAAVVSITLGAVDIRALIPVLPLVNGDTPGPGIITDSNGQCIGVPLL
jgi:hypothetical protein